MTNATVSAVDAGSRPRDWRLPALVCSVVLVGLGCVALAFAAPSAAGPAPALWRLALVTAMIVVGESAVIHLKFGRDSYTFTWSEASIVLGVVLLAPGPWLSLVAPLAATVAHVAARRDPVKVVFNAASMAVGATLAAFSATAITGGRELTMVNTAQRCAALIVAASLHFLWNSLSVSAAIAAARREPFSEVVRAGLPLKLAVLTGNTIVGLLLVTAEWHGSSVVLIPFSIALLYLAYRGYLRAMEERDVWRQLDQAAQELSRLDENEVATVAVARAAQLFKTDTVELAVLPLDDGPVRVVARADDGTQTVRTEPRHTIEAGASDGTSVHVRGVNGAATTWVVAPLEGIGGCVGSLRLGITGTGTLSERQRQVLTTFAHGVGTSLENARLYGEMRHQADRNAHEATHDPLTGLANRKLLYQHAAAELAAADRDGGTVALLLLDLDYFKEINDTLGHNAGDDVLCAIARRLTGSLRHVDLVARLGGDEFAVLLSGIPGPEVADNVARDLLRVLAKPIEYEGTHLAVGGSVGVASHRRGATVEDLLRQADVAMYQAKESRSAFAHYRSDRDGSSVNRITLVAELRNAIDENELVLHFQPQVDLETGRITGAEVLTRWQHPIRGLLAPAEFISVAEHSGLIRDFTLHILDRGVAECAVWRRNGVPVPVSVNLSARNLLDRDLPDDVARILARHGLPADQLILEITETTMMSDHDYIAQVLAGLRRVGVELSVDDFGTGYSSLAILQRVAVNEIKIDRTFVQSVTTSVSDMAIVRATVELARGLGLRVVAEGVETAEQESALRALGCNMAQGWHFGRPAEASRMRDMLGLRWATGSRRRALSA